MHRHSRLPRSRLRSSPVVDATALVFLKRHFSHLSWKPAQDKRSVQGVFDRFEIMSILASTQPPGTCPAFHWTLAGTVPAFRRQPSDHGSSRAVRLPRRSALLHSSEHRAAAFLRLLRRASSGSVRLLGRRSKKATLPS